MVTVKQVLQDKGSEVWTIGAYSSVYDALKKMAEKNVGALVVLDEEKLAGIFSERDYARKCVLEGKTSKNTSIADLMTVNIVTVSPEKTLDDCMSLMTENRIRHLPVVEGQKLIGLISIGDVVNRIIAEQKFALKELKNYISGGS